MHILYVVSWYKTPENPMIGSFFEEFARGMMKRGHQVGAFFPDHNMQFRQPWKRPKTPDSFVDKGIPTFYAFSKSIIPGVKKMNFIHFYRQADRVFQTYVKQYGMPDLLHGEAVVWGGLVANWLSKKYEIPFVLTEHSTNLKYRTNFKYPLYFQAIKSAFLESKKLAAVSHSLKNQLINQFQIPEARIQVIPNLLPDVFFQDMKEKTFEREPFQICMVGYLIPRKRFSMAIDIVAELLKNGQPVELTIIGDGPLYKDLVKQIEILGLQKYIHLAGLLSREEVRLRLDQSHCLLSTSEFETFGVNIIESLARGRPVVTLDSLGPRDIVRQGKDGYICNNESIDEVVLVLRKLIKQYNHFHQLGIHNSCKSRFSESAVLDHYESWYIRY